MNQSYKANPLRYHWLILDFVTILREFKLSPHLRDEVWVYNQEGDNNPARRLFKIAIQRLEEDESGIRG